MLALLLAALQPASAPPPSPGEIAAAAPTSEWVEIAADDLLVMDLAPGATGRARRVVIQLVPAPFARAWVDNTRTLARAHWWDGTSVNRVQGNYVAQWGDATEAKPLPPGIGVGTEAGYTVPMPGRYVSEGLTRGRLAGLGWRGGDPVMLAPGHDAYAAMTGFALGFPFAAIARDDGDPDAKRAWPVHCYATVGVGRNLSPDTGSGAELYAVIGHAPRHLDRNIAVVGRVIEGIEHLSSLPRGTGALGFYETPGERVAIQSIRLAAELPENERPRFQYLGGGETFARYVEARRNREPPFFIRPAGGADICNIPVPVRRTP